MATSENPLLELSADKQQELVNWIEAGRPEVVTDSDGNKLSLSSLTQIGLTRREAMLVLAMVAGGSFTGYQAIKQVIGTAKGATGNAGTIGEDGERPDIFGDDINANTITDPGANTTYDINEVVTWTDDDADNLYEQTLDGIDVPTVSNDNYIEPQVVNSASTSYTVDLSVGNYHKLTLTGDVSIDFSNVATSLTNSVMLQLVQDSAGGRTPSFSPTVVWGGGSPPSWSTSANAEDVVTLVHDQDGSKWLGFVGGLGMA